MSLPVYSVYEVTPEQLKDFTPEALIELVGKLQQNIRENSPPMKDEEIDAWWEKVCGRHSFQVTDGTCTYLEQAEEKIRGAYYRQMRNAIQCRNGALFWLEPRDCRQQGPAYYLEQAQNSVRMAEGAVRDMKRILWLLDRVSKLTHAY